MPDFGSATFSQNDSSNNSGTMPSWSGSAAPSTLDDAGRALQGAATREWNWRSFTLTATGTSDAKVLSYSVAPAAYYNGQRFAFIANTTNTTTATLNVNSLGAKTIKKDVSGTLTNLSASEMVSGMFVEVTYNTAGDCFVWVNRGADLTGTANTWSAIQTFTASPIISVTDNTNAALRVTQLGTGLALRIEDEANPDSTPFVVDASGNVGVSTTTLNAKLNVSSTGLGGWSSSNYGRGLYVAGTGASNNPAIGIGDLNGTNNWAISNNSGALFFLTMPALTDGATAPTERLRMDASGNVLVTSSGGLGYGTGSGGTVTQLTSKATGVTINKTNGQIVTAATNVGTATPQSFVVTNSTVAATDTVIVHRSSGGSNASYAIGCDAVSAGSFRVYIANVSSAGLAETLTLNFAVIKAVTA